MVHVGLTLRFTLTRLVERMCLNCMVNVDNPDVLEIWNIVFIQFNKYECVCHKSCDSGILELNSQHIATISPLLVCVLHNNLFF